LEKIWISEDLNLGKWKTGEYSKEYALVRDLNVRKTIWRALLQDIGAQILRGVFCNSEDLSVNSTFLRGSSRIRPGQRLTGGPSDPPVS
jgi:hypothetical protein